MLAHISGTYSTASEHTYTFMHTDSQTNRGYNACKFVYTYACCTHVDAHIYRERERDETKQRSIMIRTVINYVRYVYIHDRNRKPNRKIRNSERERERDREKRQHQKPDTRLSPCRKLWLNRRLLDLPGLRPGFSV